MPVKRKPVPLMQTEPVEESAVPTPTPPTDTPSPPAPPEITVAPADEPIEPPAAAPPLSPPSLSLESPPPSSPKPLLAILIALLILSVLGGGAYYWYTRSIPTPSPSPAPTTESTPAPSASASPLPRGGITLEILNGTSTPGLAAATAETFQELGYTIDSTGNAEEDADTNQLFINQALEDQLEVLFQDVLEELEIEEIAGYLDDPTVSARLILGQVSE